MSENLLTASAANSRSSPHSAWICIIALAAFTVPAANATSLGFGSSTNISFAAETTAYTAGSWTEAQTTDTSSPGYGSEQIDCVVAIATTTHTCGNPGPGSSADIPIYGAPGGTLPTGTTNYAEVDGDLQWGAPIYSELTGLIANGTYTVTFYEASNEENGNTKAYDDNWLVYGDPGATTGTYMCPTLSVCTINSTSYQVNPPAGWSLLDTSTVMDNLGGEATNWEEQSFTFKATSTTEVIEFVANAVAVTAGTFMPPLLDLAAVTVGTPEPACLELIIVGLGAAFVMKRLRRRRAAGSEPARCE